MVLDRREEKGRRELREIIEEFSPFSYCPVCGTVACTSGSLIVARDATRLEVTGCGGLAGRVFPRGEVGRGEPAARIMLPGRSVCL